MESGDSSSPRRNFLLLGAEFGFGGFSIPDVGQKLYVRLIRLVRMLCRCRHSRRTSLKDDYVLQQSGYVVVRMPDFACSLMVMSLLSMSIEPQLTKFALRKPVQMPMALLNIEFLMIRLVHAQLLDRVHRESIWR